MFFREWFSWCYLYLQHTFVMMYWITVPGLLLAAFFSLRYRAPLRETALKRQSGFVACLSAIGLGFLDGNAGRASRLRAMEDFRARGVSPRAALGYLVSAQAISLPVIGLFTVLIGLEFGLGLLLGGLVMILLTMLGLPLLGLPVAGPAAAGGTSDATAGEMGEWSWGRLWGSRAGWRTAARWVGGMFGSLWLSSVAGLLLAGLVLALDMHEAWILPAWLADENSQGAALASALLAPLLSTVTFLSPLGNLVVAASIWKTWTLSYPGLLSFALAASFHPLTLRALSAQFGARRTAGFGLLLYLTACLAALVVPVLWHLIGLEVTHVPWLRDLVDRIQMALPFTMLGTGGMPGGSMMSH